MKTILHVSNTWALSQLIHLVIYKTCLSLMGAEPLISFTGLLLSGALYSLPAYWLCLCCYRPVQLLPTSPACRMLIWAGVVALCILTSFLLVCTVLAEAKVFFTAPSVVVPGIIASWIAILLRLNQFRSFREGGRRDGESNMAYFDSRYN